MRLICKLTRFRRRLKSPVYKIMCNLNHTGTLKQNRKWVYSNHSEGYICLGKGRIKK